MADETNKSLNELIKIEEERLALQKKQLEETAEDRKERIDKKAMDKLVAELKKDKSLLKDLSKASDSRLDELLKGPMAKIAKSSKKNVELQTAIFSLSRQSQKFAAARITAERKVELDEKSFRGKSARILSTLAGRFLENTQAGQAISLQLVGRSEKTANLFAGIEKRRLTSAGALKAEFLSLGDGFRDVKTRLGNFQDKVKGFFTFFIDPRKFIKTTASAFSNVIFKPLGKLLFFLIKLPLKGIDKMIGVLRGTSSSKLRLKQVEDKREKARDQRTRDRRDTKEASRLSKLLSFLRRGGGLAGGLLASSGGILKTAAGAVGKGVATGVGGAAGFLGLAKLKNVLSGTKATTAAATAGTTGGKFLGSTRLGAIARSPVARFASRILLPAVVIGNAVAAGLAEFKKTKSIEKALGEGLVGAATILSFGLVNKNDLRKKIKDPFIGIVEGINGFLEGEFKQSIGKFSEGATKLVAAPFDIAFKMGTQITSSVGRFFGAEKFANELDAVMKNFNIGESLISAVDTIVKVFTKATADKFLKSAQQIDPNAIKNIETLASAEAAAKGLNIKQQELASQAQQLEGEEQTRALAAAEKTRKNLFLALERVAELREKQKLLKAQNETLTDIMLQPEVTTGADLAKRVGDNATLRDRAGAPVVVSPITAPTIVQSGESTPVPIPMPLANRNNENTLQRVADNNFRGASP